jgi:hypothetical protein
MKTMASTQLRIISQNLKVICNIDHNYIKIQSALFPSCKGSLSTEFSSYSAHVKVLYPTGLFSEGSAENGFLLHTNIN